MIEMPFQACTAGIKKEAAAVTRYGGDVMLLPPRRFGNSRHFGRFHETLYWHVASDALLKEA